jgi:2-keto-4-pentenoate hydratase
VGLEIDTLVNALIAARDGSGGLVEAQSLAPLSKDQAMDIQSRVQAALGESTAAAKISVVDGGALIAPIFAGAVIKDGDTFSMPRRSFVAIEIEVAAILSEDYPSSAVADGAEGLAAAIDHFVVGIEILGTRLHKREEAGKFGALADNFNGAGYVVGRQKIDGVPAVDGLPVRVSLPNGEIRELEARHPFGGPLSPILAFGRQPHEHFPVLGKGVIVTTGSLTTPVAFTGEGKVSMQLGDYDPVSFTLALTD